MAASTIYTGQADLVTINVTDSSGVAIPHASIDDIRVMLEHENGDTLLKFRKVEPTDWPAITTESGDGVFTFEIQEKDSKTWPKGKVHCVTQLTITDADFVDGYKPMDKQHILNVEVVNYSEI